MIGLDSNVLIRYLTNDDAPQAQKAAELLNRLTEQNPGFVSVVALIETVWVLGRFYRFRKDEIARAVEWMLEAQQLVAEHEQAVFFALTALQEQGADFSDALIAAIGQNAGCTATATFDAQAARLPGFQLLS